VYLSSTQVSSKSEMSIIGHTWVATYASDGMVTFFIPWIRAFPDLVARGSLSTELGDVNICLNACAVTWASIPHTVTVVSRWRTYRYQQRTSEHAIPHVLRVVIVILIQENRPLIPRDDYRARTKTFLCPSNAVSKYSWRAMSKHTAGHSSPNRWGRAAPLFEDGRTRGPSSRCASREGEGSDHEVKSNLK
jgi:hypothetical protein